MYVYGTVGLAVQSAHDRHDTCTHVYVGDNLSETKYECSLEYGFKITDGDKDL